MQIWERARQQLTIPPGRTSVVALGGELSLWNPLLLDWLVSRFGPTTKPFPRTYVAQEVTTFLSDSEAEALITRSCTSCHEVERVNAARFSPDRWRVVTVDMRERGAKLEDEELERLVEWLGRTKGTNPNQ